MARLAHNGIFAKMLVRETVYLYLRINKKRRIIHKNGKRGKKKKRELVVIRPGQETDNQQLRRRQSILSFKVMDLKLLQIIQIFPNNKCSADP